ncbi:MAG: YgdI/YgdR family lipoprotein [Fibrobacter sp.]|nr:YgdI/YgdR family lipoprotein [Fibrobacter sp.]
MKKTLIAMMAMLFVSLALVACSSDSVSGSWDSGIVDNSLFTTESEE